MFTGIVQFVGTVARVEAAARRTAGAGLVHRLAVELGPLAEGLALGASVAVNGVCLTVASLDGRVATFDVVPETWRRSTLASLRTRDEVNLERSLRVGDPLDGHFVQGHVDGTGIVERIERGQGEWKLCVRATPELMPAIVPKGSIALDGTSLTIVDVLDDQFSVALVPTTLANTVLARRQPGEYVNIETDILARIVLHRLAAPRSTATSGTAPAGLTWERLRNEGFAP
jgi:riboflavin synthase